MLRMVSSGDVQLVLFPARVTEGADNPTTTAEGWLETPAQPRRISNTRRCNHLKSHGLIDNSFQYYKRATVYLFS